MRPDCGTLPAMTVLVRLVLILMGVVVAVLQVRWAARASQGPVRRWHASNSLPPVRRHLSDAAIAGFVLAGALVLEADR
jgi:hypothetical protein